MTKFLPKFLPKYLLSALMTSTLIVSAHAAIPVIDSANLAQANKIADNTRQILDADKKIMEFTQKTLEAVTGDRSSDAQGDIAKMSLGSGFSMGKAPSLGSVITGGSLSFSGMGSGSQDLVSKLIMGLQLVKTISGLINGQSFAGDQAYQNQVNSAATITGLIDSTQGAVKSRSDAFTQGGQKIGQAKDLKGSIDQNSQIQVQNGLAVNELTGVTNTAVAAVNQQNLDYIKRMSDVTRASHFKPQ